ncbi:MAG: HAD family hydrolase, partial [bacterium]
MTQKAIFFDLDGTLLTTDKRLTERNRAALLRAVAAGHLIVPATGRLYDGMPDFIRALPLRYALTVNGAEVYDVAEKRVLLREELPTRRALEIFDLLEGFDCVYDCYAGGWGYMDRRMYNAAERYVIEPAFLKLVKELRTPVEDLRDHVR